MDATVAAMARGLLVPHVRLKHWLKVAVLFGGFQALMPLLGWALGRQLGSLLEAWGHWIAFAVFMVLGLKMLADSRGALESPKQDEEVFGLNVLLVLAIATSLDAFAVGVTLPFLDAPLGLTIGTIGVTTAILSGLGVVLGRRLGALLGKRLDVLGGLFMIGLGIKILLEHGGAS